MGSRANYVIVDEQGWRLYYSHWGAARVDAQLAAGPAYARRFIEQQQPCAQTDWLDNFWAEGGVLMDTVARRLLLFGGSEIMDRIDARRAYLALLGQTWPGWAVSWAYKGITEIASYVDVVLVDDPPGVSADRALVTEPEPDEMAEGSWALLTVRSDADGVRAWALAAYGEAHPVWGGERLLAVLPGPDRARQAFDGRPPAYGLHLDVPGRWLGWWAVGIAGPYELVAPQWPGWRVEFWQDRYEEQVEACAGAVRLPAVDPLRGLAEIEEYLAAEHHDPVQQVLSFFGEFGGPGLKVNPAVAAHVDVEADDGERRILADGLAAVRARWSAP